ncbi:MAG: tRNA uridine-5-carboxymethylaminomethyl(34) synthesis GTPase MnmE [Candidatus Omnitrophota bacterium]|jgi:tRNA modification GTPase
MQGYNINDTIVAIATGAGESGIGIVRISGQDALCAADRIFVSRGKKPPSTFKTYTTHYGWVVDGREIIDEAILTVMRAPKSYTREDIVEINCHGGILPLRRTLELALENGCRLAEPGEFTRRAFLNGRIDLSQAEAVMDIIRSKTGHALKVSAGQLLGVLSSRINKARGKALDILSALEADIDFPDDAGTLNTDDLGRRLRVLDKELVSILDSSKQGRILREGINVVICGKPNAGKSSLLNALLKQERSIVTPLAGTTRDTVEEIIDIKGIPIRIVDTAGIIEPRDLIEKKAIERSKKYIAMADLVILLFDASRKLSKEDNMLMKKVRGKKTLAVINKADLKPRIEEKKIIGKFGRAISISAKKLSNIGLLESAVADSVYDGKAAPGEPAIVSNIRHIEAIKKAQKLIAAAADSLDNKIPAEFIAQDLRDALGYLDDISGRRFTEDLLDRIFSEFCIGK